MASSIPVKAFSARHSSSEGEIFDDCPRTENDPRYICIVMYVVCMPYASVRAHFIQDMHAGRGQIPVGGKSTCGCTKGPASAKKKKKKKKKNQLK
jgi:hypothetical protein